MIAPRALPRAQGVPIPGDLDGWEDGASGCSSVGCGASYRLVLGTIVLAGLASCHRHVASGACGPRATRTIPAADLHDVLIDRGRGLLLGLSGAGHLREDAAKVTLVFATASRRAVDEALSWAFG